MYNPDFKWKRQYEAATLRKHEIYDLYVADLGKGKNKHQKKHCFIFFMIFYF